MKLFTFLPCYNEEQNIVNLIGSWVSHTQALAERGYELQVIGIDDCSKDTTKAKIEEMTRKFNNVVLFAHEVNKGLSGGLNTAIAYFLENGSPDSLMAMMDGDNTHDPKYIFAMLDKLEQGADCVIASRYCMDSKVVGVASHREFLSDMARLYYKFMLQVPQVEDYTCGYRLYRFDIIQQLTDRFGQEPIQEKSFACMMELLYRLYLVGASFDEAGFELRYDNKLGASKMRVLKTMSKSLTTAIKLRKLRKVSNGNATKQQRFDS